MSETCDRCGPAVGAASALSAQGWTFWPTDGCDVCRVTDGGPLTIEEAR